jgi:hypothetical protein
MNVDFMWHGFLDNLSGQPAAVSQVRSSEW